MHPKTILVPIDFSAASRRALAEAVALAQPPSCILLLHVVTAPTAANEVRNVLQATRARLKEFARSDPPAPCPIQCHVRLGIAFQEILKSAEEENVDLIVLVRDPAPLSGLGKGHTADRISRYASCPVMMVRSVAAESETASA